MFCLWCDEELIVQVSWMNLFQPDSQRNLCDQCKKNFIKIDGKLCVKCGRPFKSSKCHDCKRWEELYGDDDPLLKNISLYMYNDFMKEVITKWKYRGDYIIGEMFRSAYHSRFKEIYQSIWKDVVIVPIPLSRERVLDRGFNQASMLASFLTSDVKNVLVRNHSEKQAKKTRMERMSTKNPFSLNETINKSVLLVDDIYTTGRTLRHAAKILKKSGCPEVYAYTLIRG